ncbi:MAG: type I restriction-modification system subunit M [Gammaproteobacteria bacterium]
MPKPTKGKEPPSVDAIIKSICDIMRRGNMAGALQYVPELSWLLFLRVLDDNEEKEKANSEAVGVLFSPALESPYRWRDWATKDGEHRRHLSESAGNALLDFVNNELLPYLKGLRNKNGATKKQKVISQIFRGIEKTRFNSQRDMLDVLDRVDSLRQENVDDTHIFTLSQVYEKLLLKMGEKNNDGGQFFTPREVIRAMVQAINPQIGETVYDPCCGTGGFLVQTHEYLRDKKQKLTAKNVAILRNSTFYGREKETLAYPIAIANLVLHGIHAPRIWHGNTLSRYESDGILFETDDAAKLHDVILTNPPFGGKESRHAQNRFDYPTSSTQVLFMQEIIGALKNGGRCAVVVDEGFLFRSNEDAFVKTKRRLLEQCNLWCVVSLPPGVFAQAGAGVKTNILFFTKGDATKKIWYYDLSDIKTGKKNPLTLAHFADFFRLLPKRTTSDKSWTVTIKSLVANNYDLKAVNPNKKSTVDTRTPKELLTVINAKSQEITKALDSLRII